MNDDYYNQVMLLVWGSTRIDNGDDDDDDQTEYIIMKASNWQWRYSEVDVWCDVMMRG